MLLKINLIVSVCHCLTILSDLLTNFVSISAHCNSTKSEICDYINQTEQETSCLYPESKAIRRRTETNFQ